MKYIKKKNIVNPGAKVDLFSIIFSSGVFVGFIPYASGTFGSLFALLFCFIPGFIEPLILVPVIVVFFTVGIFVSNRMMKRYGDDPSVVIVDEVVGMWITILIISRTITNVDPLLMIISLLVAFLSFRFFDIMKIQPAKYFDNFKNGFGIMMDDVIAGVYAGVVTFMFIILLKTVFIFPNG